MIQIYRPAWEIEQVLSRDGSRVQVTDARMADGRVQYDIQLYGQSKIFTEDPSAALMALRVTGVKLTGVEFKDGNVWYTLAESS